MDNKGDSRLLVYPNPVHVSTSIKYYLEKKGYVTLSIYDMAGKKITQLVNEIQTGGMHTIDWNASDVEPGIYILTLVTKEFKSYTKLLRINF